MRLLLGQDFPTPLGRISTPFVGVGEGTHFSCWTFKKSVKGGFFLLIPGGVWRGRKCDGNIVPC